MSNISKSKVYITIISIVGMILLFSNINLTFDFNSELWSTILYLILSTILLNHFIILLPPRYNGLSFDSSIYLASAFIFGLHLTLTVLLLSSIIFALYRLEVKLWAHLFNLAMYTIMIVSCFYTFTFLGGTVGDIQVNHLFPYIVGLGIYYILNVLVIGTYFILKESENPFTIFKNMMVETVSVSTYLTTLVLSLILGILLTAGNNLGLFLFTSVVVLLSIVFKRYFALYESVSKKAIKDELTGLYNHSYFKEILDDYIENKKAEKLSLAFIDIDDFKKYNDYYGHLAGDELLKFAGKLLLEKCNNHDFFVARYGGEEFVILMPNVTREDAFQHLNRLRKEFNDSYFKGVEILPHGCLSFSGGIVQFEPGDYSSSEFIGRADQAMYRAKSEGKNIVRMYDPNVTYEDIDFDNEMEQLEQQLRFFLYKDVYTYQHSKRVFQYANLFSQELGLNTHDRKTLILGALIHDIGKIEIPRNIINKKGKLDAYEWDLVKQHVIYGKEIVSTNKSLHSLLPLVELHHERFDGKGYPHGLKGENIPKLARILCIIDSFDVMTTERPYQPTKSFVEAIDELERCSGTQFDPNFVPLFIKMIEKHFPDKLLESSEKSTEEV